MIDNFITIVRNGETIAVHRPVQLDNLSINFLMTHDIPFDTVDMYSIGWWSPVPQRNDSILFELPDPVSGQMLTCSAVGRAAVFPFDHLEVRLTLYMDTQP